MKIFVTLLMTTFLLTGCNVSFNDGSSKAAKSEAGTEAQQTAVAKVAGAFLSKLDSGDVQETWSQASPYLQKISNQTAWATGIETLRSSVGAFKSRKLKGIGFTHTIDGAPAGDYAAIAFDTTFANSSAEEKVVLQNSRGEWKILGYFVSKSFKAQL